MRRIWALSRWLIQDWSRSLWVIVPPGLTLALHRVFFLYGATPDYFVTVGAAILGLVCLVTVLLFAANVDRASSYVPLAQLPRRSELVAALILASLLITLALAFLFAFGSVALDIVELSSTQALALIPRWLGVFIFAAAFGLHLTELIRRYDSHLLAYGLLIAGVVASRPLEYPDWLPIAPLANALALVFSPVSTLVLGAGTLPLSALAQPLALTLAYSLALFALAAWLFARKDLLWSL